MKKIIPNIITLIQYIQSKLKSKYSCVYCGSPHVWYYGYYYRKSDRSGKLNPIAIQRFFCRSCKRTFSVLPECIPPRRWYLWDIQQSALILWLKKLSYRSISQRILPSRKTIRRWIIRLQDQFLIHSDQLKTFFKDLYSYNTFDAFWSRILNQWRLSKAMVILNNANVIIP